ncbi:hypothetical protein ACE6H2_001700 [Prunus campanulata]
MASFAPSSSLNPKNPFQLHHFLLRMLLMTAMKTPAASALSLSTAMTQPLLPAANRNTIFTVF